MLNRHLKLYIFIAIAAVSALKAQGTDTLHLTDSRVKINMHAGVEYNYLGNLKTSFTEIRDYLRGLGVSVPDQLESPHSNSFGAAVLFSLKERMYFGIRFEHLSSKAYLLYGNFMGKTDLKSSLSVDKFFVSGQYVLPYSRYFSPLAEMNLGLLSARYDLTNMITFYKPFFERLDGKSSGKSNTLAISLFLGAQNKIHKNIVLFEKLGYQFSGISGIPVRVETDSGYAPVTINTHVDLRALLLQFGAEYQL